MTVHAPRKGPDTAATNAGTFGAPTRTTATATASLATTAGLARLPCIGSAQKRRAKCVI